MKLRNVGKKVARMVGLDVRPASHTAMGNNASEHSQEWDIDRVRKFGPEIKTCVDVGSAGGTPELYQAFPNAFHVMIDPLEEYESKIKEVLAKVRGKHFRTALGSTAGTSHMTVEGDWLVRSSLMQRSALTRRSEPAEQREVPIVTLDALAASEQFEAPFGLKIDTEGFELEVIRGSQQFLKNTAFVIAEVSYGKRFESGYAFPEFTEQMASYGFYLNDILRGEGRDPVRFFDAVFKPITR